MPVTMYVPASWVRPDTLDTAFAQAGFALLNDDKPHSKEPILEDQYLTHAITGNLTVGYYSGLGNASDGCSSRLNFTSDARGIDLRAKLRSWALANGVSDTSRPSVAQGIDLVANFIPLMYGPAVVRDILSRLWSQVTSSKSSKGLGQKAFVDAVLHHFRSTGAFARARPSSASALPSSASALPSSAPALPSSASYHPSPTSAEGALKLDFAGPITPPATPAKAASVNNYPVTQVHRTPGAAVTFSAVTPPATPSVNELHQEARIRAHDDAVLREQLRQEAATRAQGDSLLHEQLQQEAATRAQDDAVLREQLRQETATRAQDDSVLREQLRQETATRAQDDAVLREQLHQETATRAQDDSVLREQLHQETITRAQDDSVLREHLRQETATRVHGISLLDDQLQHEATTRAQEDSILRKQLLHEAETRTDKDAALEKRVQAEAAARAVADADEARARHAAVTRLQQQIRQEVSARAAADAKEARTRQAADARLQQQIRQEALARSEAARFEASQRVQQQELLRQEAQARSVQEAQVRHNEVERIRTKLIAAAASSQKRIRSEALARSEAMRSEAAQRSAQDTFLQTQLAQEAHTRQQQVDALREQLRALVQAATPTDMARIEAELHKRAKQSEEQGKKIDGITRILKEIVEEMVAAKKSVVM